MLRSLNKSSSGRRILGTPKVGVLGSSIPSTGTAGPAYTYNDLDLPSDADKYIRGVILSGPSSGDFFAYEDTSFIFSGAPDGTYYATYQLFVDNVAVGSPATITLVVGEGLVTINGIVANASAEGLSTAVTKSINTSVGSVTAQGVSASVLSNRTIQTFVGDCVSQGVTTSLNISVNTQLAIVVAAGLNASVSNGNYIGAGVGNVQAQGLNASLSQDIVINSVVGSAQAEGATSTILLAINCDIANTVSQGSFASVFTSVNINALIGNSAANGLISTVVVGTSNIKRGDRVSFSFNTVTYSIRLR